MAIYAPTRADLRQELAMMMQDNWASTATGGSTTTVVDTKITQGNNFWRNAWVMPTAGTSGNIGQIRQASGSTLSTTTVTVGPAFSASVASGDTYEMFKRFSPDVYHQAINQGIREAGRVALADKVDTSVTLASSTFEYTLPSGFLYIRRLSYLSGSTDDTRVFITPELWYIRMASTRKLVFDGSLSGFPAVALTIEGQSAPAEITAEATACPVHPNYVLAYAKFYLHSILAGSDDDEASYHERQMLLWERQYKDAESKLLTRPYPGSRQVEPF